MQKQEKTTKDFHFKQFSICGGLSGMPVSTDGVLLGAWCNMSGAHRILDIGTGTGLLALMCAQRYPKTLITAVELEPQAAQAAEYNFSQSPWKEKINLIHNDIKNFNSKCSFDAIICNPPYFNSGAQSEHPSRAIARHTNSLSHDDLINKCKELITLKGRANFILPLTEGLAFIHTAENYGWFISRLCKVRSTANKPVHRLLIELSLQKGNCDESELVVHDIQGYSESFTTLTRDFYLKM